MPLIRCTQKLLKEIGIAKSELLDEHAEPAGLGDWYANLLVMERKKAVIFTNELTLLTFMVVGLKREQIRCLDDVFREGLIELLQAEDVSTRDEERILGEYRQVGFGRTADRSILGSQNDLASMAQYKIAYDGGLSHVELAAVNADLNGTPMSRLGMESPRKAFQLRLAGETIPSTSRKKPAARKKKPQRAALDEIIIKRSGGTAIIQPKDSRMATTHLEVGPKLASMSDKQVLAMFNATIEARDDLAARHPDIIKEIPPGRSQIRYHKRSDQWTPRGSALRCVIGDMDGQAVIHIDDKELTIDEFGRLLTTYSGWGMRIEFMSEESLQSRPPLVLDDGTAPAT